MIMTHRTATAPWPFDPLPMMSFSVIMIDPPWAFQNWSAKGEEKSAKRHYDCMPTPDIAAMPVGHLAGRDCWLWLWATWAMLPDAMHVMEAWGFRYVSGGPWVKRGASGKLAFGTGYIMRECNEVFLLGKVGEPRVCSNSIRNLIEAPRRQHSRKPDLAYATCEELFGPARRADLFSRQNRKGWESWGREAGKFDPGTAFAPPSTIPAPISPAPATAPLLELCGG